jgi:hypothetical protein
MCMYLTRRRVYVYAYVLSCVSVCRVEMRDTKEWTGEEVGERRRVSARSIDVHVNGIHVAPSRNKYIYICNINACSNTVDDARMIITYMLIVLTCIDSSRPLAIVRSIDRSSIVGSVCRSSTTADPSISSTYPIPSCRSSPNMSRIHPCRH